VIRYRVIKTSFSFLNDINPIETSFQRYFAQVRNFYRILVLMKNFTLYDTNE